MKSGSTKGDWYREREGPGAHPMTGPIFVDGAQPGDSLRSLSVSSFFIVRSNGLLQAAELSR
jgi:acetamidase/formamidase